MKVVWRMKREERGDGEVYVCAGRGMLSQDVVVVGVVLMLCADETRSVDG